MPLSDIGDEELAVAELNHTVLQSVVGEQALAASLEVGSPVAMMRSEFAGNVENALQHIAHDLVLLDFELEEIELFASVVDEVNLEEFSSHN